ncbi:MAG: hypothetical protein PWP08_392 [Methanofollis sp.]|nr:hypothetical protein [Methanofollis sp.]
MDIRKLILLSLFMMAVLTVPALAGTESLYGKPELSAAISGTNEFDPGDEFTLPVIISNNGLNTVIQLTPFSLSPPDDPSLAKLVEAGLSAGSAPVTVKSESQQIGDIPGGTSTTVNFIVKIDKDAPAGTYDLPLTITYTYADWTSNERDVSENMIRTGYLTKTETMHIPVKVTSDVNLEIESASSEHLNIGTEGYLYLTLRNAGHEKATNAVAKLVQDSSSPLIPADGTIYIGDFYPGDVANVTFKVSASDDAEVQTYPVGVYVEYKKANGETADSDTETVGVPVGGKIDFAIISEACVAHPGEKAILEVTYKNIGAATAYNAQSRISAVDPFTSSDDSAYLGDLAPGETAVARYTVTIDSEATIKQYGLDSEIRYRDALDNSQISDTMKLTVNIEEAESITGLIVLAVVVIVLIGAGYYIYRKRKAQ